MTQIKIRYKNNYKESILNALSVVKEYNGIDLEKFGELIKQFRDENDILCDIPSNNLERVIGHLSQMGFECEVVKQ